MKNTINISLWEKDDISPIGDKMIFHIEVTFDKEKSKEVINDIIDVLHSYEDDIICIQEG